MSISSAPASTDSEISGKAQGIGGESGGESRGDRRHRDARPLECPNRGTDHLMVNANGAGSDASRIDAQLLEKDLLVRGSDPFDKALRTRFSVSSPERVVRSMQVMALSNQAAWLAFLIDLRPGRALHLLSIAEVLACTDVAQSRSSSIPGFLQVFLARGYSRW